MLYVDRYVLSITVLNYKKNLTLSFSFLTLIWSSESALFWTLRVAMTYHRPQGIKCKTKSKWYKSKKKNTKQTNKNKILKKSKTRQNKTIEKCYLSKY